MEQNRYLAILATAKNNGILTELERTDISWMKWLAALWMWWSESVPWNTRLSRGGAADLARRLSCSEHWDLCWAVIWDFRSETTTILELAHNPNCSCIRDFVTSHVLISWETIKRRSPIAGIVPECPDQWRFRSARCDFHDYYLLITELVTHTISSRAGWLWKPTKVGIIYNYDF